MTSKLVFISLFVFYFITGCLGGDTCYYFSNALGTSTFYYCSTGCCGYYYSRECCSNVGTIAGSVVGGLIVLAIIIGIITCCVLTHKQQQERLRKQRQQANIVTIVHAAQNPYSHPPPDYSPFGPAGGATGQSNPAYPPNGGYGYGQGGKAENKNGGMITTSHAADPPPYA